MIYLVHYDWFCHDIFNTYNTYITYNRDNTDSKSEVKTLIKAKLWRFIFLINVLIDSKISSNTKKSIFFIFSPFLSHAIYRNSLTKKTFFLVHSFVHVLQVLFKCMKKLNFNQRYQINGSFLRYCVEQLFAWNNILHRYK